MPPAQASVGASDNAKTNRDPPNQSTFRWTCCALSAGGHCLCAHDGSGDRVRTVPRRRCGRLWTTSTSTERSIGAKASGRALMRIGERVGCGAKDLGTPQVISPSIRSKGRTSARQAPRTPAVSRHRIAAVSHARSRREVLSSGRGKALGESDGWSRTFGRSPSHWIAKSKTSS
jgi:hypothetical protein